MSSDGPSGATRILERPGGSVLLVRPARLVVTHGPDKGREIEVKGRPLQVGSGAECDLVLSDATVSARHFVLEPGPDGLLLRDLDSTNGTRVDGYRVQAIYLPGTAQIDAGENRLKLAPTGEEIELPLSARTRFGALLGSSPAMRQVFAVLERVAGTDSTVLLEGESGTGKELAARALHEASPRRGELFVTVDCGALPAELVESELFGHSRGAFTGAAAARAGLFEEADRGTLFLDEIGELPLAMQPKLLRVLETRSVRRLGETGTVPVDVRLVAATNRNLQQEVEAGRFRKDLFFRLSVIRVALPPLRQRREEIPRLVAHFTAALGRDPSERLPDSVMQMLQAHSWPGNVRELRNVVERLLLLPGMRPDFYLDGAGAPADPAAEGDAAASPEPPLKPFHEGKKAWTERFERAYLASMLRRCGGNISEVARISGLSRQSCHRLLSRYGLEL